MVNFREIIISTPTEKRTFGSLCCYYRSQRIEANWLRRPFVLSEQFCANKNERLIENLYDFPKFSCSGLMLIFGDLITIIEKLQGVQDLVGLLIDPTNEVTLLLRNHCRLNHCIIHAAGQDFMLYGINPTETSKGNQG